MVARHIDNFKPVLTLGSEDLKLVLQLSEQLFKTRSLNEVFTINCTDQAVPCFKENLNIKKEYKETIVFSNRLRC
jgi:hypothetical protein